jgi:hypothetical protein
MKLTLILTAIVLLSLDFGGCGGGSKSTLPVSTGSSEAVPRDGGGTVVSGPAPVGGYRHGDDDGDFDPPYYHDDSDVRHFAHAANPLDKRGVETLVKRYYATAAGDDGAAACSLMTSSLARDPNLGDVAEAAYPIAPSVPPLQGKSCASIMSLLFAEDHRRLVADSTTLQVVMVRVGRVRGLALLGFKTTPERQIGVAREHGVWKIAGVLDRALP